MSGTGFLNGVQVPDAAAQADREAMGFVMNVSTVWAQDQQARDDLFATLQGVADRAGLSLRTRAVLVAACAGAVGDSYCALAWGERLAAAADPGTAAGVLRGDDAALDPAEQVLAAWARRVVRAPGATSAEEVQVLREAGWNDRQVFAATVFVGLRQAWSAVNAALGAQPDAELAARVPVEVREAVSFGRPPAGTDGSPSSPAPAGRDRRT